MNGIVDLTLVIMPLVAVGKFINDVKNETEYCCRILGNICNKSLAKTKKIINVLRKF